MTDPGYQRTSGYRNKMNKRLVAPRRKRDLLLFSDGSLYRAGRAGVVFQGKMKQMPP